MSKKHKAPAVERPLHERIAAARRNGQTQQALDLTRQYYKVEQTEERRELLRQVTLERGQQLQGQGSLKDAATVYGNALTLGGGPDFVSNVAQRLARCGDLVQAWAALEKVTEAEPRQRLIQHIVDGAVALGPNGKAQLSTDLHPGFDLLLQAFAHYDASRDEDARTALQGIGLQSPFLEWKVLLRGLLAHASGDDVRAVENWQRLDAGRLPARLAAPLRATIDPEFLKAQPASVKQALGALKTLQQGHTFTPALHDLRKLLQKDNLKPAFRKAEQVAAAIRQEAPEFLPRFAQCFYWAIVEHGEPDDIERYLSVFGAPADDREGFRLEALALEARGMWPEAHKSWENFLTGIGAHPTAWPGDVGKRAQALVWARMAENASPHNRRRRSRSGNPLFDLFASHTAPLKPSAEQCLEKSIKLAPDRLDSYRALFDLYRDDHKLPKAKKVGQQLLERFPDHAETLEALGELAMDTRDYKKAQEYFEKSIQANPLDRDMRGKLARARQNFGLSLTIAKKYDQAREQYEKALAFWEGAKTPILCQWAVAEMKAGNPSRAEELIAQALAQPDQRLAARYALVGESVRAKLSTKEKKQIAQNLKDAFTQSPTPAEILVLVESAAHQRLTHDEAFHGQKSQEKTILKFLETIHFEAFSETQLERLSTSLGTLQASKPWLSCLNYAQRKFLANPSFRLAFADYYLLDDRRSPKPHLAKPHLDQARRLVEQLPRGELQQQYLEQIKEKEQVLAEMNVRNGPSMMDFFGRMFDEGFGPDFSDEDEDFFGDEDY